MKTEKNTGTIAFRFRQVLLYVYIYMIMSSRKYSVLPLDKQKIQRGKGKIPSSHWPIEIEKKSTENQVKTGSKSIKIKTINF